MGLYDGVMVKDNHLLAKPELQEAILSIRRIHPDVLIEVEADSIDQVRDFVNLDGIDVILLDNMSPDQLRACVSLRRPGLKFEASGGVSSGDRAPDRRDRCRFYFGRSADALRQGDRFLSGVAGCVIREKLNLLRWLLPVGRALELAELFEQTGIGSDELPVLIEVLQQCGFVFCRTEKTIGIVKEPESLFPEMILAGLQTNTIGRDVLVFRETSSTNDRARQAGVAGARRRSRDLCRKPDRRSGDPWPEMGVNAGRRSLVFDSPPYASPGRSMAAAGPDGGCRLRRSG